MPKSLIMEATMKKTVLTVSIVLTILIVLVVGTYAVFSAVSPEISSGNVTAKQFTFNSTASESFGIDVEIAPTESFTKEFSVSNFKNDVVSATDMLVSIVVEIKGEITPLQLSVAGQGITDIQNAGQKTTISFVISKNEKKTQNFVIKVEWPSTENDNDFMGKTSSIIVNASAVQC